MTVTCIFQPIVFNPNRRTTCVLIAFHTLERSSMSGHGTRTLRWGDKYPDDDTVGLVVEFMADIPKSELVPHIHEDEDQPPIDSDDK